MAAIDVEATLHLDRGGVSSKPVTSFPTIRVAAVQATPVILDAEATVEKACALLAEAADQGVQLAVFPETFVPLYPSNSWGRDAASFEGWDEFWERLWENSVDVPGPHTERIAAACARARHPLRDRRQRARVRAPGVALQRFAPVRPGGPAGQAPQADADHARAALPRGRRGQDLAVVRDAGRATRRPDLLGEHDAARPLRRLSRRPADLARPDRGRQRRLARERPPYRDRVGRVRRLGAPVHSRQRLPGRLPGPGPRRQRGRSAGAAPRSSSRTKAR